MTQLFDVFGLDATDVYVRTIALALPIAVLLTLFVLLGMNSRKKKARREAEAQLRQPLDVPPPPNGPVAADTGARGAAAATPMPVPMPRAAQAPQIAPAVERAAPVSVVPASPLSFSLAPASPVPASPAPVSAAPVSPPPIASVAVPPVAGPEPQAATAVTPPTVPAGVDDLKAKLNEKLANAPKDGLAPLYLELAQACRSVGDEAGCLAALRSAAGVGAQHGPRAAHAEARIALAEAAYNGGDLHGACEQWQMARMALFEDGQKDAYKRIDKRMLQHGCPTDWVLTDF